ncbi:hypothetical protein BCR44DRAFT_35459, partial [Catenaria anguillulae PL171]
MNASQPSTRPLQAHIANQQRLQQQQQQQQHVTSPTPIAPMHMNNNLASTPKNAWAASRPVAIAVAALVLLTSVFGIYMSTSYISEIQMVRSMLGGGSLFHNKTLNNAVDAAYSAGLTYLYMVIVVCVCQIVACGVGMFSMVKQHLGYYKVYMFGSGGLLVVRIVFMVLLRGWWYLIVSVLVQAAAVYPMWVYWREWEERKKYGLSM